MLRYFFIFALGFAITASAEYRVFELEITSYADTAGTETGTPNVTETPNAQPATATATSPAPASVAAPEETGKRTVLSTLDPQQYRGYHTIQPNEKVRYISTWRCRGRTTGKDYCPNPKAKTEGEVAAASSETK